MTNKEITIQGATAVELKPGHKYLICVDQRVTSRSDVAKMMERLREAGVKWAMAWIINGDPTTAVKIIGEPSNDK